MQQEENKFELEERNETGLKETNSKKADVKKVAVIGGLGLLLLVFFVSFKKNNTKTEVEEEVIPTVRIAEDNFFKKIKDSSEIEFEEEEEDYSVNEDRPPFIIGESNNSQEEEPPSLIKSSSGLMTVKGNRTTREEEHSKEFEKETFTLAERLDSGADPYSTPAFTPSVARKSLFNPNLLLSQGTVIPCSLRGKLVSSVGGQISCTISDDVFSTNGNVVLIEKGSTVNGYYQGNSVQRGQNYLFVVWQEVRTPKNLVIPLHSGSADELGANGLKGWVDNHFWKRFGNAIVLSLIKDVSGALAQNMTKDSRRDSFENTRNDSVDIATEIIKMGVDIAPTLYKNQGEKINIFVARDIDFSKVYNMKRITEW